MAAASWTNGRPAPGLAIGIDVGGSKIVAGLVSNDGQFLGRWEQRRTPDSAASGLPELLAKVVSELAAHDPSAPVGVGVAGIVRWPDGSIEFAANHAHGGLKLGDRLAKLTNRQITVENDANAAAWSEASTANVANEGVLFVSVGTGLGSGFVVNGAVLRGQAGRGAELGHLVVDRANAKRCSCGLGGCLEAFASGWALQRDGRAVIARDPGGSLARLAGRTLVDTRFVIDAALAGDPQAVALVEEMGRQLGRAIAENVMSLLPVDRVVLGGGLAVLDRLLLDPMRGACQKTLARSKMHTAPKIGRSTYGQDAVVIGAARLALAMRSTTSVSETA